ncbi:RNA-directed DNA polymerase [Rhizobium leguminosarum]|uniref:RNA-directed DNA polymerase n=1 Tax=Rhizobium leguminosarum TaxID=384 RepID=UPI00140F6B4E|nr:RNA-directed DNA polymerase [Rhizobium leguminosarum]QIO60659.1 RNA-directed DNA polymerase [Rhizobium leguminosarum bv. trifolii]
MSQLIDLPHAAARKELLRGSSYFSGDFPTYISFESILDDVSKVMSDDDYTKFKHVNPEKHSGVNYSLMANKDGRFAWRPLELMNPAIYVSLVNLLTEEDNWQALRKRFGDFEGTVVECCSSPVLSIDEQSHKATQVGTWWRRVEQRSLAHSLEYSHLLHTDVTDCYGSLYTHSISWALHGLETAKGAKGDHKLLGNKIDRHVQAGRYGQTNGISQGSVLMDLLAELVLGYVDEEISKELKPSEEFKILRYRDDFRIFANSDYRCEEILKIVSDKLRSVGMKLNGGKTWLGTNVITGSVKEDKLAGIELQDLGEANAQTIQKQLLRLHGFGRKYPNSGALRRLLGDLHTKVAKQKLEPDDLDVQVAIATDIAMVSPLAFPAIAGILSHLVSLSISSEKEKLWSRVHQKMSKIPHNGYLEIWLQRVTKPQPVGIEFVSTEPICQIVNGKTATLWFNDWVSSAKLKKAMDPAKLLISKAEEAKEAIDPSEIELFNEAAAGY